MPRYKVTFAPHDVLSYTYEVEVDDPNNAEYVAMDDFRFDKHIEMIKETK